MNIIVAVDKNWAIGANNNLLYDLKSDLTYFKEKTLGKVVVMGEKTLHSLPNGKPLKNRTNICISANKELKMEHLTVVHSLTSLFEHLKQYDSKEVYIIGGSFVYEQLLNYCDTAFITKIDAQKPADKFFPNLDVLPNWQLVNKSVASEENGITYYFCEYKNNKVLNFH